MRSSAVVLSSSDIKGNTTCEKHAKQMAAGTATDSLGASILVDDTLPSPARGAGWREGELEGAGGEETVLKGMAREPAEGESGAVCASVRVTGRGRETSARWRYVMAWLRKSVRVCTQSTQKRCKIGSTQYTQAVLVRESGMQVRYGS